MRREVGAYNRDRNRSPVGKIADELSPCTFKPEINKVYVRCWFRSQRIVKSKNIEKEEDRINELYYDSVRQAERRREAQ